MKTRRFLPLIGMALAVGFVACTKDEDEDPVVTTPSTQTISGEITSNTTWYAQNTYYLTVNICQLLFFPGGLFLHSNHG